MIFLFAKESASREAVNYKLSPFFLWDSKASETRTRVKITPREKGEPFSLGVVFTLARVSLALLSLRKNRDYSYSPLGTRVPFARLLNDFCSIVPET